MQFLVKLLQIAQISPKLLTPRYLAVLPTLEPTPQNHIG